jgi:ferric-dicitrate binding protein FerR (iron transport regulator)
MEQNYNDDFLKKVKPPFEKSKADVWAEMEAKMGAEPEEKVVSMNSNIEAKEPKVFSIFNRFKFAIAAAIAVFLSVSAFMKFYTKTMSTGKGEHLSISLPDNSKVNLNVNSSLSYQPYWWRFNRTVELSGEAFFDVEKGKTFTVESRSGKTEVLGTSFNIETRHYYSVYCKTGKVRVTSPITNEQVVISPNELAFVKGDIQVSNIENDDQILGWKDLKFVYNAEPLITVFEEISMQYDVELEFPLGLQDEHYTGSFNRNEDVKVTLDIICQSFDLKFKKQGRKFILSSN